MKKCRKSGFTLIEAILAVAIIGTIAALVIPPLMSGAQNKKHAAALGRSVEVIETGCQNLVQSMNELSADGEFDGLFAINKAKDGTVAEHANDATDIDTVAYNLFQNAPEYFGLTSVPDNQDDMVIYHKSVRSFSGEEPVPAVGAFNADYWGLSPKIGTLYTSRYINKSMASASGSSVSGTGFGTYTLDEPSLLIYIDVNGVSSPNRYGRDVFVFALTNDCHMIPAGTAYVNGIIDEIPLEGDGCKGIVSDITNGLSCTSRIVKDGYKIEYMK